MARTYHNIETKFTEELQGIGLPTKDDEWILRRLSSQMKDKNVCVKPYLKEPHYAKLYIAYSTDDKYNKIRAIIENGNYKATGKVEYDEYYPRYCKQIDDRTYTILAKHYWFTEEEYDFIINYDIKYIVWKMNKKKKVNGRLSIQ